MAYTVRQVSGMSGVSVRTLHFYDEAGILKPAYHGQNGYRFYEQPQLLMLQQILFYRELGFSLKQIKRILSRPDFERASALQSHREVLLENVARSRALLETIDKTIVYLKGEGEMRGEEMFGGFSVPRGQDRFGERVEIGGEPNDCKVSARDTNGALCVFEFMGTSSGPRHSHLEQDEWIYVIDGELELELGADRRILCAGESAFLPRNSPHAWAAAGGRAVRIVDAYQPAGRMEDFFREVGRDRGTPIHAALSSRELLQLFSDHGMELLGPPLTGGWTVNDDGRIIQTA